MDGFDELLEIIKLITITLQGLKEEYQFMENTQKKTAPSSSTAIDVEQTFVKNNVNIIPSTNTNSNNLDVIFMTELFDNIYPPRILIIDNLLYAGIYLFVCASKVGKRFKRTA